MTSFFIVHTFLQDISFDLKMMVQEFSNGAG